MAADTLVPFSWEAVDSSSGTVGAYTQRINVDRSKVYRGWIVRTKTELYMNNSADDIVSASESSIFVYDEEHVWALS